MNTQEIMRKHVEPSLPPLRWSDRLALHVGANLIRWAGRPQRVRQSADQRFDSVTQRRESLEARYRLGLVG